MAMLVVMEIIVIRMVNGVVITVIKMMIQMKQVVVSLLFTLFIPFLLLIS